MAPSTQSLSRPGGACDGRAVTEPPPHGPGASAPSDHRSAAALRALGPAGIFVTVIIALTGPVLEPLGAVLTLFWARSSETPWRALGFVRPRSWWTTATLATLTGVLFKLAMKSVVMPLLGAPPANQVYRWLAGNTLALPGMMFDVIVGAGFNEELVFRGFLFLQLQKLLGTGLRARIAIVILTSVYFGGLHWFGQGLPGAQQATIVGLAFGTFYATTGRLWPLIIAHATFDATAVVLIYKGLETNVAQWCFR